MAWRSGQTFAVAWLDRAPATLGAQLEAQTLLDLYLENLVANPVCDPENNRLLG